MIIYNKTPFLLLTSEIQRRRRVPESSPHPSRLPPLALDETSPLPPPSSSASPSTTTSMVVGDG